MSDEKKAKPGSGKRAEKGTRRGGLATWQIVVVVLAVLVMAAGLAIGAGGGRSGATPSTAPGGTGSGIVHGLAPGEGGAATPTGETAPEQGVSWSPVVFRLGFGAFVGFAVGYALRSFLRLSLFALGFFFLMLLGLQYAQIIEIHWGAMEARYDQATSWIGSQTQGFMGFVTGQLPAAGLGVAGLLAGLKRK